MMSKEYLEAIDNAKLSEALEKFDYIGNDIKFAYDDDYVSYDYTDDVEYVKQALLKAQENEKILSVLKEKNVWVARLKGLIKKYNDLDALRIYNANMPSIDYQLTQEEFDLLKRWLG